ncbi:hypothetical protein HK097_006957 [Rhizophlyctis rosea]|uniref:Uncharacterized protein n=1 Tax=Rhizophlyctis rosea TaxID=64517 RepID=A0AAD5X5J8_9FUNG|nr:hypothetical protein HK097_006957 [Rhizophlyctis rosea]
MAHTHPPTGISLLPSELIDAVFLRLDIFKLSCIYLSIPSLKSRAATALDIHIKSLTLTLGTLIGPKPCILRCDKNLSTSRYLYYFRFFRDGHFSQGSFHDDVGEGLPLTFFYTHPTETVPETKLLSLRTDVVCHENICPDGWHTSLLKPICPNRTSSSEPARHEHFEWDSDDIRISMLMFHLDWFAECCSAVNKEGRVALTIEEGVQSVYLRRLMERVEEKEVAERLAKTPESST